MDKEMATHSSVLAWRIPGTEEPGGLPSMRLHRVRHDRSDLAAAADPIIQSEVSQKEKDKYHILTHIYEIWKNSIEEFIYRATMEKET